jgi:death-on-curing protein
VTDWRFVDEKVVCAAHGMMLARHGGSPGIRDAGALASALDRPRNLVAYAEPDITDLAAAYAFGIVKAHVFVDGNKRTGWVVMRIFIKDNGGNLVFAPDEAVQVMVSIAAGQIGEPQFADWLRDRIV